jgi:hypothetical protein
MKHPGDKTVRWYLLQNRTSYAGMYLAGVGLVLILFIAVIDWMQGGHSSYVGLLLLLFSGMVALGGMLILFGAWRKRRRAGAEAVPERRLDLNEPADRRKFHLLFVGGAVLLNIVVLATYAGYRYTETSSFCGSLCHTMTPEYVAYQSSPHAHIECVECHVGPGLSYFLKYKFAGARQLANLLLNNYPAPIPTPVESLRPARAVCEHCHWPGKFFGTKLVQRPHFRPDEKNTAEQITLGVKIGGRIFHSIHFGHITGVKQIEYSPADRKEQDIPWVSVTRLDGSTEEYRSLDYKGPDRPFAGEARIFDCIGCHNRPTHIYLSPDRAVNIYLAANLISRDLPWIKKVATEALGQPYPDRKQAHAGIQAAIKGFYERRYPELRRSRNGDIDQTVARVVELYDGNIFPEMKVNWKTHADNSGHKDWPGCFRCHDGRHATKSGKILGGECTLCHTMPVRGPLQPLGIMSAGAPGAAASWHPLDLSGQHGKLLCNRCHQGGNSPPATCTECHKIDPEAPMIELGCDSCHRVPQEVTSMTPCGDCHSPKGLHMKATHAETTCTFCHKPHQWRVTGRETCMQCHGDRKGHNPGAACATCHVFE